MLLHGRVGVVAGVRGRRSLGWHVAQAWLGAGASRVWCLTESEPAPADASSDERLRWLRCDVAEEGALERCAAAVGHEHAGGVDMVLHAIAFAPKRALSGRVLDVSRADFSETLCTSAHSFLALGRAFEPLLVRSVGDAQVQSATEATDASSPSSSSLMALTFDGSERVVPGYGVMGPAKGALEACARCAAVELGPLKVRVNCISAGPVRTLAARSLPGFNDLRARADARAPLGRPTAGEDVGAVATFLASDLSAHVTGETLHVDGGAHVSAF